VQAVRGQLAGRHVVANGTGRDGVGKKVADEVV